VLDCVILPGILGARLNHNEANMQQYTPPQVSKMIGLSVRIVRRHWQELGGKKIGKRVYFTAEAVSRIRSIPMENK